MADELPISGTVVADPRPESAAARQRKLAVQTARASKAAALEASKQVELEGKVERAVQGLADRVAEQRRQLRLAEDGGWMPLSVGR